MKSIVLRGPVCHLFSFAVEVVHLHNSLVKTFLGIIKSECILAAAQSIILKLRDLKKSTNVLFACRKSEASSMNC